MIARIFGWLATTVSTLMLLLAIALWPRSYWTLDSVGLTRPVHVGDSWRLEHYGILWTRGSIALLRFRSAVVIPAEFVPAPDLRLGHTAALDIAQVFPSVSGEPEFGFALMHDVYGVPSVAFVMPFWFVIALSLPLPALAMWRARRRAVERRRRTAGLCTACGYDLRATADRCPECGAPVPVGAEAIDSAHERRAASG